MAHYRFNGYEIESELIRPCVLNRVGRIVHVKNRKAAALIHIVFEKSEGYEAVIFSGRQTERLLLVSGFLAVIHSAYFPLVSERIDANDGKEVHNHCACSVHVDPLRKNLAQHRCSAAGCALR